MEDKLLNINQVAKLCGITVRALHYYNEIGLLKPTEYAQNGYRKYDKESLSKLQQILFFKELDIPLKQIKEILDNPSYDKNLTLVKHKKLLTLKRDRLNDIIALIDESINENCVSIKEFDMREIKKNTQKYAEEAMQRWGETNAYKQSEIKTAKYTNADWEIIKNKESAIFTDFASCMNNLNGCKSAETLVEEWQNYITSSFYDCTDEILAGLADLYVTDERFKKNIDKFGENLAEFMSSSIKSYLAKK